MSILVCEICDAKIGQFDPDLLEMPLTGDQFSAIEPGFPAPFWLDAGWSELTCSYCHNRAVGWDASFPEGVRRDRIKTPDGYFIIGKGYERRQPVPFSPDYTDLDAEWEAMSEARYGKEPADMGPKTIEPMKRPYHRKDKKRGR